MYVTVSHSLRCVIFASKVGSYQGMVPMEAHETLHNVCKCSSHDSIGSATNVATLNVVLLVNYEDSCDHVAHKYYLMVKVTNAAA